MAALIAVVPCAVTMLANRLGVFEGDPDAALAEVGFRGLLAMVTGWSAWAERSSAMPFHNPRTSGLRRPTEPQHRARDPSQPA